jgi:cephalosporin hydroxylase
VISGKSLADVLHAVATDHQDRALNIVVNEADLDESMRSAMAAAIIERATSDDQARALGDALRDADADQFLINECYRLAFYLSDAWSEMANNPLYARFTANKAAAVLDKWVHYFPIYARHLKRFRNRPVRVLEVGVYRGGGLDMWASYLGSEAELVGLDIDEAAVRSVKGRYQVVLGDQADPEALREINEKYGPFDIVIDDGGHTMQQQIVTVETLFPLLNDGGAFIIEDTHTSYWPPFGGELHSPDSLVEWTKLRIDDLHSRHHVGIDRNSIWATDLDGMHWYDSVVVFDKKHRFRPFNEMAGSSSFLYADRFSEGLGVEFLATRDQALRERDSLREQLRQLEREETDSERRVRLEQAMSNEEELRVIRSELQRARELLSEQGNELSIRQTEAESMRGELLDSWTMVRDMRHTSSWRLTKPIRAVRRLISR